METELINLCLAFDRILKALIGVFVLSIFLITDEKSSDDTPRENNAAVDFIKWVFDNTMVKATEVFEKITKVVTEFFNSHNGDGNNKKGKDAKFNNWLEEKLRTSVLLSIVVLLVVMVSRACNRS